MESAHPSQKGNAPSNRMRFPVMTHAEDMQASLIADLLACFRIRAGSIKRFRSSVATSGGSMKESHPESHAVILPGVPPGSDPRPGISKSSHIKTSVPGKPRPRPPQQQ